MSILSLPPNRAPDLYLFASYFPMFSDFFSGKGNHTKHLKTADSADSMVVLKRGETSFRDLPQRVLRPIPETRFANGAAQRVASTR